MMWRVVVAAIIVIVALLALFWFGMPLLPGLKRFYGGRDTELPALLEDSPKKERFFK